jgi:hypothetical protein
VRRSRSSAFLRAVDALCAELQERCGLTRFSIVIERSSGPLTVTLQNQFHSLAQAQAVARLELEVRDGERRLGEVLLEDSLAQGYPEEIRRAASDVLTRHVRALRDALPA